jgi:hypothetical protein
MVEVIKCGNLSQQAASWHNLWCFLKKTRPRNHSEIIIGRNSMNDMMCAEIGKSCRLVVLLDSLFPSVMSVQRTYEQRWKPESRNAKNP